MSNKEWKLIPFTNPYLFLRDTAKIDDLKALLKNDHPYIRIYSFAAIAYRKQIDLFQLILDQLSDTTRITQITIDYAYDVYPADLMLDFGVNQFTRKQKGLLKDLILQRYNHLNTEDNMLLLGRP